MKNYLGVCSLKITRPNSERSEILVSNPDNCMAAIFAPQINY